MELPNFVNKGFKPLVHKVIRTRADDIRECRRQCVSVSLPLIDIHGVFYKEI